MLKKYRIKKERDDMKVTQRLLKAVEKTWDDYYTHPFVSGIKEGTLDKEKFRYYILQDYLYLIDYARVFALGAAKSPDVETMTMFAHELTDTLDNEMDIHDGYMGLFGITQEELETTPMAVENSSYTSYMLRVAYEEDAAAICASVLACAYSYEVLAKRMVSDDPKCLDDPLYGEWISGYASDEYAKVSERLIAATDRLCEGISEERYAHLEKIFVNCSLFEDGFWDMAWNYKE